MEQIALKLKDFSMLPCEKDGDRKLIEENDEFSLNHYIADIELELIK